MKKYKIELAKLLYQSGIRDTLPAQVVNEVKINENNEALVDIKQHPSFFFGKKLENKERVYLRALVYNKLCEAEQYLPQDYYFKIYSAYRSMAEQQSLWDKRYEEIKSKNPTFSEDEIIKETKRFCADPRHGFGGHQTGGAVDIGLCMADGTDYPMGTQPSEVNKKTKSNAKNLTPHEQRNRHILSSVMKKAGFVNYPQEWWHFSYGDRLWAAYKNKKSCMYGLAKESKEL